MANLVLGIVTEALVERIEVLSEILLLNIEEYREVSD